MQVFDGTWSVVSADAVPPPVLAFARKMVGGMLESGMPKRQVELLDGTVVHALIVNGVPKVTVSQRQVKATSAAEISDLWVPRGFVVYPAWIGRTYGVGLPIVQDGSVGPYDPANLAPGLDAGRWTPGGPCGEVLVSKDANAGYPDSPLSIVAPLLFDLSKGPRLTWNGDGFYDGRPSTSAWKSYRMELATPVANYSDENIAASLALFEQINTYRAGLGLTELVLLPRGYYRPAKIMASIMLTNGSTDATYAGYPAAYQTPDARLTKDGFSAAVMEVASGGFGRGDQATAWEMRVLTGSVADAMAAFEADTDADAALRRDVGKAGFADVGYRASYWCADVIKRTRWIEAGNMGWLSPDASLPPVTWMGFASVNLAWETFPVTINPDPATQATHPLLLHLGLTDGHGDCWLNYPRSTSPETATIEPAMGRHIYMRGRSIAMAPRGGLVWGACVASVGGADRLVALVHHPEDQDSDKQVSGYTRYLRVWWVDVPPRANLRMDPQNVICGEDLADDWAWRGGALIDVGVMPAPPIGAAATSTPNSLKMASQWRFSPDGSKAICLRDYGSLADYAGLYDIDGADWVVRAFFGKQPRAVELHFNFEPTATNTTVSFHDYTGLDEVAGRPIDAPLDCTDVVANLYEYPTVPVAVDYAPDGSVLYAFTGYLDDIGQSGGSRYDYMGTGPEGLIYPSDLGNRALMGAQVKTASQALYPWTFQVADVVTGVFACEGAQPPLLANGAGVNPDAKCFPFSTTNTHGVRMYAAGVFMGEDWFADPDGLVFSWISTCLYSSRHYGLYADLPLALSRSVQVFAPRRQGQQVVGYQVSPIPAAAVFLDTEPSNPDCGCQLDVDGSMSWMTSAQLNPRGGRAWSGMPLPDNDWLIYAKAV